MSYYDAHEWSFDFSTFEELAVLSNSSSVDPFGSEFMPSEYVDWMSAGHRIWTEEAALPPASGSSLQFSFTGGLELDLGSQLSSIQSRPPTPPQACLLYTRSPSPFIRSLGPSPGPELSSSNSSSKASDATKVDFTYDYEQDNPSGDDSDQEYRPVKARKTSKGRKTTAYKRREPPYSHGSGAADESQPSLSVQGQKRKRADPPPLQSPNQPKKSRQRRRNAQVRLSDELARPVARPDGIFVCPVPACTQSTSCGPGMKRHIDSHLGKSFKCPVCERVYSRIDAARRHLRDVWICQDEANKKGLEPIPVGH